MTDRYAVIGNPIEQSKSPLIHTAFAQVTGQDIEYTKVLSPLGAFAQTVDAFRAAGGRGMNVTAPFKLDAFAYATDLAPGAQMAGAVGLGATNHEQGEGGERAVGGGAHQGRPGCRGQ